MRKENGATGWEKSKPKKEGGGALEMHATTPMGRVVYVCALLAQKTVAVEEKETKKDACQKET